MTFTLSPDRMPSAIATDPRVAAHTRIGATVSATVAWSIEHSASSSVSRATILDGKNHEGGVLAKPDLASSPTPALYPGCSSHVPVWLLRGYATTCFPHFKQPIHSPGV